MAETTVLSHIYTLASTSKEIVNEAQNEATKEPVPEKGDKTSTSSIEYLGETTKEQATIDELKTMIKKEKIIVQIKPSQDKQMRDAALEVMKE